MNSKNILLCLLIFYCNNSIAQSKLISKFDKPSLQFEGTKEDQAKYLLKHVKKNGLLDPALDTLPQALHNVLTNNTTVPEKNLLQAYLNRNNISNDEVGGALTESLSKTSAGITARYFVIHDASSPNFHQQPFPVNINDSTWNGNDLTIIKQASSKKAHIFVNRTGNSIAQNNLNMPWRATKFELSVVGTPSKGLFLHIEMIQPRRTATSSATRDEMAPEPGFSDAQLKRLALLYITASVRKGEWLVPAFHAVLDEGLADGHDDPQHFDLTKWSFILQSLINEIKQ
jgi:hypothetical protein